MSTPGINVSGFLGIDVTGEYGYLPYHTGEKFDSKKTFKKMQRVVGGGRVEGGREEGRQEGCNESGGGCNEELRSPIPRDDMLI